MKTKPLFLFIALIFLSAINFVVAETLNHLNWYLWFNIERKLGVIPSLEMEKPYHLMARNLFSADSGTGVKHSNILNISPSADSITIDSIYIYSDSPYLLFRSVNSVGRVHPFLKFVQSGYVKNINKHRLLDLEIMFSPYKSMKPGFYSCNLWFVSKELGDSGFVKIEFPAMILYNPYEWFDTSTTPGIELKLTSAENRTVKMVFGSSYMAKLSNEQDTLFGKLGFQFPASKFSARFVNDIFPWGYFDYSPNDENRYSNSRDIQRFRDDYIPLIYKVRIWAEPSDYPIVIEYDDKNFPENALFIMTQNLNDIIPFRFDMRKATIVADKHQYIISDTSISEFYIVYYRNENEVIRAELQSELKQLYCPGDTVKIGMNIYPFENNIFFAELSDTNGSFENDTRLIGVISTTRSGIIDCIIPDNLPESNKYRLRIRSVHPEFVSNELNINLNIFPRKPVLLKDTSITSGSSLKITPLSPRDAEFFVFDSITGGNIITSGIGSFVIFVENDAVYYVEGRSMNGKCITHNRAKLEITAIPDNVQFPINDDFVIRVNLDNYNETVYVNLITKKTCRAEISVYNLLGNKQFDNLNVFLNEGTNLLPIAVSSLESGLYLMKIGFENYIYTCRFLISK